MCFQALWILDSRLSPSEAVVASFANAARSCVNFCQWYVFILLSTLADALALPSATTLLILKFDENMQVAHRGAHHIIC
jgi:hypothetical protein